MTTHAYTRVSTPHQKLQRQITNILDKYPSAIVWKEHFTGTTQRFQEVYIAFY